MMKKKEETMHTMDALNGIKNLFNIHFKINIGYKICRRLPYRMYEQF